MKKMLAIAVGTVLLMGLAVTPAMAKKHHKKHHDKKHHNKQQKAQAADDEKRS